MPRPVRRFAVLAFGVSFLGGCGSPEVTSTGPGTGAAGGAGNAGTGSGGAPGGGFTLPNPTGSGGGAMGQAGNAGNNDCGVLVATVRDFKRDHADFERAVGTVKNLVKPDLGPDHKPVYGPDGSTAVTEGRASFDEWYRDVPGVNMRFMVNLPLKPAGGGVFVFENSEFFPLDGMGFGNEGHSHNFHFTTEIHASFKYRGGEKFTFKGDDDVFVFVNGKLALDLGGVHGVQTETVDFDGQAAALGISVGNTYRLDVFHAERHTSQSNFRIETSIDCLKTIIL